MKVFPALAALLHPAMVAAEPLILAPGKSVAVIDAEDPSIRVILTAPANRPLNVGALLAAKGGVYALAIRMQVPAADTIVRNADGTLSLGASAATVPSGAMLQNGVIVVDRGTIAHHAEAPVAVSVSNPMENALRRMVAPPPVEGPVNLVGAPPGALFLPTGIRIR